MPEHNWDEIDRHAERFYHWEEFARKNEITKKSNPNHVPKCYRCSGTGKDFDKITLEIAGDCPACGGRGCKAPRPKFPDHEIKSIVSALGPERIKTLVQKYGDIRKRRS